MKSAPYLFTIDEEGFGTKLFTPENINSSFMAWMIQLEASSSPHHAGEREKTLPCLCLVPASVLPGECTYSYAAVHTAGVCALWRQTGQQTPFKTHVVSVGL